MVLCFSLCWTLVLPSPRQYATPRQVEVVPDRTVGENCFAESMTPLARNGLYDAVAGETGWYRVKVTGTVNDPRSFDNVLTYFTVP